MTRMDDADLKDAILGSRILGMLSFSSSLPLVTVRAQGYTRRADMEIFWQYYSEVHFKR